MERKEAPKKLYYKIGEACRALDIQPYVLRYWETEFPLLSPSKSKSGQRVYTAKELNVIRRIKELLYDEGYTIAGAKKKLDAEIEAGGPALVRKRDKKPAKDQQAKEPAAATGAPSPSLDSRGNETVETLRRGVERALGEAREILALLDSK